ncbi:MAG: hypothetical protein HQL53_10775 [Magnetococcales bacterium]|nr:hypothetical protein [Magnetococcales bacterium]
MGKNQPNRLIKMRKLMLEGSLRKVMASHQKQEGLLLELIQAVKDEGIQRLEKSEKRQEKHLEKTEQRLLTRLEALKAELAEGLQTLGEKQTKKLHKGLDDLRQKLGREIKVMHRLQGEARQEHQALEEHFQSTVTRLEQARQQGEQTLEEALNQQVERLEAAQSRQNRQQQEALNRQVERLEAEQKRQTATLMEEMDLLRSHHAQRYGEAMAQVEALRQNQEQAKSELAGDKAGREELSSLFSDIAARLDLQSRPADPSGESGDA